MIETPQLWLPDRLRQRREDERLMRLAGLGWQRRWMPQNPCCCEQWPCTRCEPGVMERQYQVTIDGVLDGARGGAHCDCSCLNDTFVLRAGKQQCAAWGCFDCGDGLGCQDSTNILTLHVTFRYIDGVYILGCAASLGGGTIANCEGWGLGYPGYWTWDYEFGTEKPDCQIESPLILTPTTNYTPWADYYCPTLGGASTATVLSL